MNEHAIVKMFLFGIGVFLVSLLYLKFFGGWPIPWFWVFTPVWGGLAMFFFMAIARGVSAYHREVEADKRRKKYVDNPKFKNSNGR